LLPELVSKSGDPAEGGAKPDNRKFVTSHVKDQLPRYFSSKMEKTTLRELKTYERYIEKTRYHAEVFSLW
jgi:hypothetical protein